MNQLNSVLNRNIWQCTYEGRNYCYPTEIGNRYQPRRILAVGGFGVLIEAQDKRIFDRKVLIKANVLPSHLFQYANNRAVPTELEKGEKRMEHERKMLLHGQLRGVADIPTLIDWVDDINPMIYGPHQTPDGTTFTIDDPNLWQRTRYLIINFVDGQQLDVHASQNKTFKEKPLASLWYLTKYLVNTLHEFHKPQSFGSVNLHFIYQNLKPGNLLVGRDNNFYLIDFGSFAVITPNGAQNLTKIDGYFPPEVNRLGLKAITPQFDIYSLVILFKESLLRVGGQKQPDLNADISLLAIPDEWKTFIHRCTDQDLDKRFKTMNEVNQQLYGLPRQ